MAHALPLTAQEKKPLWDHCGIVAAYSTKNTAFFQTGLRGLQVLQTRGYDGAGFWAQDTQGLVYQYKSMGMVNEVFSAEIIQLYRTMQANIWVYQVRYGTNGETIPKNVQPIMGKHVPSGQDFVVAHNGQFVQSPENTKKEASDTLEFTQQISRTNGPAWDERIVQILQKKKGAWSLVVGTSHGLYLARDSFGFRPLVYGKTTQKNTSAPLWLVASETSSLEAMGVKEFNELIPGTIAKITSDGFTQLEQIKPVKMAVCMFENVYIHHGAGKAHLPRKNPKHVNKSPSIDMVRRNCGKILAREAPVTKHDVDMVIGIPGTGIEGGMQYARALNLPYFQAITDRAHSLVEQRTFMTAKIDSIYKHVLNHFAFDGQTLKKRRVVLIDDSIVRGNITKGLIYLLRKKYYVQNIHLRILCPPIDKTCHLGVNTRSKNELIAAVHDNDLEKIRKDLQADSLHYLSSQGLKEAVSGKSEASGFCMGCMAGHTYPIDTKGNEATQ